MKTFSTFLHKKGLILLPMLLGLAISSCSSYKNIAKEDGIYEQSSDKEVVVTKEKATPEKGTKKDNYFAHELDKYENIDSEDTIFLDAEDYAIKSEEAYTEDEDNESNAAWGYDTENTNVTYHVNYNGWYHPNQYHYPYGYNWGYYSWHHRPYYYRPYSSMYMYNYSPFYGGYAYNPYFYGGYNSYGYGYYNPYYYGGYGYNGYYGNHYQPYRPYNQYGRRGQGNARLGRRSLSRSVAGVTNNKRENSIIRGSGRISERFNTATNLRGNSSTHRNIQQTRRATKPRSSRATNPSQRRVKPRTTNSPRENSRRIQRTNQTRPNNTSRTSNKRGSSTRVNNSSNTRANSSRLSRSNSSSNTRNSSSGSRSSSGSSGSSQGRSSSGRSSGGRR